MQVVLMLRNGCLDMRVGRYQIANFHWIIEKVREFQKNIYFCFIVEKEMTTHSSILAWRIPGTEEPSGLMSMGSHRVRHN